MATIEYQVLIQALPDKVYHISQDYACRYDWDPFPEQIELLHNARDIAVGVQVKVVARNGLKMIVEFIQIAPPKTAAVAMVKGPFFLDKFAGSWIFSESNGQTLARFRYNLRAKPWARALLIERLAAWYFTRAVRARLDGLKRYCESH